MIRQVPPAVTFPLRQRVLHPELQVDAVGLPGDDRRGAAHFAAFAATGELIGIVTVIPEPPTWEPAAAQAWRLRGMATAPEVRGRGEGVRLVSAALDHVRSSGGMLLWCTARLGAVGFYQRMGFATRGEPWEEPIIGPHIAMWRRVGSATTGD